MTTYYSPSTKGFYISEVHGVKGATGASTPSDAIQITEAQHKALIASNSNGQEIYASAGKVLSREIVLTHDEKLVVVRASRDRKLAECDWTQYPDSPLTDEKRQEWVVYRQALRDFPETLTTGFDLENIEWPTVPA
jgi:hypothetical protein